LGTQRTKTKLNIFLEYASEGSVATALHRFGPLSEFVVRKYTTQLLQGLAYLHARGVIHRDIKVADNHLLLRLLLLLLLLDGILWRLVLLYFV
jgi:serine/threonine protein kinase